MLSQSLVALACGDSYGAFFEQNGLMGTRLDIKNLPNKSLTNTITDDTKMAMILLKHYKNYKKLCVEKLFQDYSMWAKRDGEKDGIGRHTYAVLVKNVKDKNSQGNGALMRVIPFGVELIKDGYSFDDALTLMNQDSELTHKNLLSKLHLGFTAWVIHSLYIVLEALKRNFSFIDGFKYIVSHGGDTDTNCAIYGAIRGVNENISINTNISDFLDVATIKALHV